MSPLDSHMPPLGAGFSLDQLVQNLRKKFLNILFHTTNQLYTPCISLGDLLQRKLTLSQL